MKSATRFALLMVLLIGLSITAKATTMMVAPVAPVSFRDAVSDALCLASMHQDAKVMRIAGTSMLPFFGEGSLVVVKPIDQSKLRAGMVVVYRNRFGETVAHRLIARSNEGWTAKGFNNLAADSTPVNGSNLIGVVYATFYTGAENMLIASTSTSLVPVALAAPAR